MREIPVAKFAYIGPTITGVAIRNTIYSAAPAGLLKAIEAAPYMRGLCIPVNRLAVATDQIRRRSGASWTLYAMAVKDGPKLMEAARKGE